MSRKEAVRNIKALNAICWQKDFYDEEFAKSLALAIQSLEAWDEVIKHLESTAKELLDREDEKQSYAFAKGITFSVSMIKSHMKEDEKEDENVHGKWEWLFNDCVEEMS